jgi:hypothetical protein
MRIRQAKVESSKLKARELFLRVQLSAFNFDLFAAPHGPP